MKKLTDHIDQISYKVTGGMGNALLSFLIKSKHCVCKPNVVWLSAHTPYNKLLDKYTGENDSCSFDVPLHVIQDSEIDELLLDLTRDRNTVLKFIRFNTHRASNTAAIHIRLGDFMLYSGYYKPDPSFIEKSVSMLPGNIDTIIVFSNGTQEQLQPLLEAIPGKYTIIIDDTPHDRPDILLDKIANCEALIRTGSTLSFCAAVFGKIPTVISSKQYTVWSEHLSLDIPGWHTIMVE